MHRPQGLLGCKEKDIRIFKSRGNKGTARVLDSYQMMGSQLSGSYKKSVNKAKRRVIRNGIILTNIGVLILVVGLVFGGSTQTPQQVQSRSASAEEEQVNPLDEISGADIAVHLSNMARLDETTAVVNNADSVSAQLAIVPSDNQVVAKPQIVNTALKSKKDIIKYTVAQGDTVASLAQRFGITSDSIRWSNNVTGNDLRVGLDLWIPPVNGIVHVVRDGDTPQKLADAYQAKVEQIVAFNDAEINGLAVGERVVVPDGQRVVLRASSPRTGVGMEVGYRPVFGGNGYDYGWCTWHAANRRAQIGRPIPTNFGNANTWLRRAQAAGFATGRAPQAGAVLYHHDIGGLGHVAFVEKDNGDGTFTVSDMNYPSWGRVTYRTIPAGESSRYSFIY